MRVAGIIAEYNPFHRGHAYHIEETRKITGADYLLVVMSGNFTQRGEAALTDKYSRARMALENGADLALELPLYFAAASAGHFALGGVSLLERLGVVDYLSFGSEAGALPCLRQAAALLGQETPLFRQKLREYVRQGHSFPKARAMALPEEAVRAVPFRRGEGNRAGTSAFSNNHRRAKERTLLQPNNILGIEYLRALSSLDSSIKPVTIPRQGGGYHDTSLSGQGFSSASALRRALTRPAQAGPPAPASMPLGEALIRQLAGQLPVSVCEALVRDWGKGLPMEINDFSSLLHYRLLAQPANLSLYADIHEDLADRIRNHIYSFTDIRRFCDLLKTKQLTHSRISRSLLHILLDIRQDRLEEYRADGYSRYARILGFRRQAAPLLSAIKKHASIPLISKLADSAKQTGPLAASMLEADIRGAHIYESVLAAKFGRPFRDEYTRQFPIAD